MLRICRKVIEEESDNALQASLNLPAVPLKMATTLAIHQTLCVKELLASKHADAAHSALSADCVLIPHPLRTTVSSSVVIVHETAVYQMVHLPRVSCGIEIHFETSLTLVMMMPSTTALLGVELTVTFSQAVGATCSGKRGSAVPAPPTKIQRSPGQHEANREAA